MNPQLLLTISPPPSSGNEDEFGDGKRRDFSEKMNLELGIWSCACVSEGSLKKKKKKKKINQGLSLLNSDYSSKMDDIEPGRCRRTDGRKWRCSKNVIPNEKYCERHMHRGSRKLVDPPIQTVSKPDNKKTSTFDDTKMAPFSLITRPICHTKENETGFENGHPRKNISSNKRSLDKNKDIGFVSTVFGLSPKSVLNRDSDKTNLDSGNKNGTIETGPQRCRRTDGKKWQCKRNSIPNQKYCETHMHRGTKRLFLHAESSSNDPPVTDSSDLTAQISRTMIRNLDNRINLNTMPESPQQSSTSDATTITDENISISLTTSLYKF